MRRRLRGDAAAGIPPGLDEDKVRQWAQGGKKLRLAIVGLESARLRYVTETGEVLERDNQTRVLTRGPLAPTCQTIADSIASLEETKHNLEERLWEALAAERPSIISQINSVAAQITQARAALQQCNAANPPQLVPLKVSLVDGALASASIPGVFSPVRLGSETYVDGGIRANLPVQAAVDLGADTIYAIFASKSVTAPWRAGDPRPWGPASSAFIFDILARSLVDIAIDEVESSGRNPIGGLGARTAKFIQPSLVVHDGMTIDPGLISISIGYGYMRAADVLAGSAPGDRLWELSDEITLARREAWSLEAGLQDWAWPDRRPPQMPDIRAKKWQLKAMIDERQQLAQQRGLSNVTPQAVIYCWTDWERQYPRPAFPVWNARDAEFVSQEVPATMRAGQSYPVKLVLRNTGLNDWVAAGNNPYRLGSQSPPDNNTWGRNRVDVPGVTRLGDRVELNFNVTAPAAAGTHHFQWRMVQEPGTWFGATTPDTPISVIAAYDSEFVSQLVPATMQAGQSYPVKIVMRNKGYNDWTAADANPYRLGSQSPPDNNTWGRSRVDVPSVTRLGDTVELNFNVTAPATAGSHQFRWRMLRELVTWFGDFTPDTSVQVTLPYDAAFVSQSLTTKMYTKRSQTVKVVMRNTGYTEWPATGTNPCKLGAPTAQDDNWGQPRVSLPGVVRPGDSVELTFSIKAPDTDGIYHFRWRMIREPGTWFGGFSPDTTISVLEFSSGSNTSDAGELM